MRVLINGEPTEVREGTTVRDAAAGAGLTPEGRGVAVAVDGEVVPASELARRELTEGQRIEVVAAIGGGS